jgi:hypothetical protein
MVPVIPADDDGRDLHKGRLNRLALTLLSSGIALGAAKSSRKCFLVLIVRRGLGLPSFHKEGGQEVVFRADAAFAKPEIFEALEGRGFSPAASTAPVIRVKFQRIGPIHELRSIRIPCGSSRRLGALPCPGGCSGATRGGRDPKVV